MPADAAQIHARLKQLEDYVAKGLMRLPEAEAERAVLRRRLLDLALPDTPAPRLPWRARWRALAGMFIVVAIVVAWLLWGNAGLKPRTVEMLAVAAGRPTATPAVHPAERAASGATVALAGGIASSPAIAALAHPASGPWLAVQVALAPALQRKPGEDDAVFIELHAPGDGGLPLAAVRKRAGDLPLAVMIDASQAVGEPARLAAAPSVEVTVRVSRTGRGRPERGDLLGRSAALPLGSAASVTIDQVAD